MAATPRFNRVSHAERGMSTATKLGLALTLIPSLAALGADEAHAEKAGVLPSIAQGIVPAIVSLVVFAVVFAILSVKVWPAISKALEDRANKIKEEIESAEMARRQAKEALEMYQKSLADARAEAQAMLDKTRAQQQQLAGELKAKADHELSQMREKAMRDIEAAKRGAIAEIYADAGNLASMMAGKILKRSVTASDQQDLVEECVSKLRAVRS